MKPALLAILLLPAVYADNTNLTYTVTGDGGISQAQAPVSDSPFWWADQAGGVSASVLDSYGYPPMNLLVSNPAKPIPWSTMGQTGSLLLSSKFDLSANQTLSVDALVFSNVNTSARNSPRDFGFGLLLEDGQARALLFNDAPEGWGFLSDMGPNLMLPTITPGVVVTGVSQSAATFLTAPLTLGGIDYGMPDHGVASCGFCYTEQTSSYSPGAGTYQLLFGTFAFGGPNRYDASAMAVKSVNVSSVPELVSWPILMTLLACAFAIRRYRVSLIHSTEV